jgi:cytochrome P450
VETFEFAGVTIEEGDTALVALLAANRDATAWPFPDSIDVDRSPNKHLAFGHGIHACVGAPLARVEARIALTSLLSRFPDLRLTTAPDGVTAEPGCSVNGLTALPVTTRPAPC